MDLIEIGRKAKKAAGYLNKLGVERKNEGLRQAARALVDEQDVILSANRQDVERAVQSGMSRGLVDRLELNPDRIQGMADGLMQVAALEDPVGEVVSMKQRPNGLMIGKREFL